ncbi:uncharacterized protein [Amphiura filiformis]|uniref:uncharacterized protein n=1 Tax=Amphiura filiformis TaxID=82378 RepID=UPI003B222751
MGEPYDILIIDGNVLSTHNHPYETTETDPVIHTPLNDTTLEEGKSIKLSVEFQTRSESLGQVLIIWEHDGQIVKTGQSPVTQGVTSLTLKSSGAKGTWKVTVEDRKNKKYDTCTQCEVSI